MYILPHIFHISNICFHIYVFYTFHDIIKNYDNNDCITIDTLKITLYLSNAMFSLFNIMHCWQLKYIFEKIIDAQSSIENNFQPDYNIQTIKVCFAAWLLVYNIYFSAIMYKTCVINISNNRIYEIIFIHIILNMVCSFNLIFLSNYTYLSNNIRNNPYYCFSSYLENISDLKRKTMSAFFILLAFPSFIFFDYNQNNIWPNIIFYTGLFNTLMNCYFLIFHKHMTTEIFAFNIYTTIINIVSFPIFLNISSPNIYLVISLLLTNIIIIILSFYVIIMTLLFVIFILLFISADLFGYPDCPFKAICNIIEYFK